MLPQDAEVFYHGGGFKVSPRCSDTIMDVSERPNQYYLTAIFSSERVYIDVVSKGQTTLILNAGENMLLSNPHPFKKIFVINPTDKLIETGIYVTGYFLRGEGKLADVWDKVTRVTEPKPKAEKISQEEIERLEKELLR